jgi:hypothetical protein
MKTYIIAQPSQQYRQDWRVRVVEEADAAVLRHVVGRAFARVDDGKRAEHHILRDVLLAADPPDQLEQRSRSGPSSRNVSHVFSSTPRTFALRRARATGPRRRAC